jgi:hypothetical protein
MVQTVVPLWATSIASARNTKLLALAEAHGLTAADPFYTRISMVDIL